MDKISTLTVVAVVLLSVFSPIADAENIVPIACSTHGDCGANETCFKKKCEVKCDSSKCGLNTLCYSRNEQEVCSCIPGYTGNPRSECTPICITSEDCAESELCNDKHQCVPVCGDKSCPDYSTCSVVNHSKKCTCISDANNLFIACIMECTSDDGCLEHHRCYNNLCMNSCTSHDCGKNKKCKPGDNHMPKCYCAVGTNVPLDKCATYCENTWDCGFDPRNMCVNNQCVRNHLLWKLG